jgi:hypothetical protein
MIRMSVFLDPITNDTLFARCVIYGPTGLSSRLLPEGDLLKSNNRNLSLKSPKQCTPMPSLDESHHPSLPKNISEPGILI